MAVRTSFQVPEFNLQNPNVTSLATFTGYLIEPYTPKKADWMRFNQGGLSGSVTMSQNTFILETLQIFVYPEFDIYGIDGMAELNYKRPDYYSIDLMLHVESSYKVYEIADRSLALNSSSLTYLNSSKAVDTTVKLHLATQGEYFRLETKVISELSPTAFLGAENVEVEMILSAKEVS